MKNNVSQSPKQHDKKGISIGTLIVCFFIACGIWLYAQAIDDEINVKSFNQLPVEFVGGDVFKDMTTYDVHSLSVPVANITISATNRELAKIDPQTIRLVADVSGAANNNYVATIRAYTVDENGEKTEIKNCEVTPAVVTVNVSKQIEYKVTDVTEGHNTENFDYKIESKNLSGTFTVIGTVQDIAAISSAKFQINYQSVIETVGNHNIPVTSVAFFDESDVLLFDETNKNENVKYDVSGIQIPVLIESKNTETESESSQVESETQAEDK